MYDHNSSPDSRIVNVSNFKALAGLKFKVAKFLCKVKCCWKESKYPLPIFFSFSNNVSKSQLWLLFQNYFKSPNTIVS